MYKFKQKKINFKGKLTVVYRVLNLDPNIFRGLKIIVVKSITPSGYFCGWNAYEETTQTDLTPNSWRPAHSNKTRAGIMSIIREKLENTSEAVWENAEKELGYKLSREGA